MAAGIGDEIRSRGRLVVGEIAAVIDRLDDREMEAAAAQLLRAKRVFLTAQGRSGLVLRAVGIRFMHIGFDVFFAGDTNTPAIGGGDLLIAISSSARTVTTLNHLGVARNAGATTMLITATTGGEDLADFRLRIPVRHEVATIQHAGSLFEQSVLVIGDCLAWYVQQARAIPDEALDVRHANLQ